MLVPTGAFVTVKSMDELRAGQRAFNDLARSDPQTAERIRGTEFDPFYDDTRLPAFRRRIRELGLDRS